MAVRAVTFAAVRALVLLLALVTVRMAGLGLVFLLCQSRRDMVRMARRRAVRVRTRVPRRTRRHGMLRVLRMLGVLRMLRVRRMLGVRRVRRVLRVRGLLRLLRACRRLQAVWRLGRLRVFRGLRNLSASGGRRGRPRRLGDRRGRNGRSAGRRRLRLRLRLRLRCRRPAGAGLLRSRSCLGRRCVDTTTTTSTTRGRRPGSG